MTGFEGNRRLAYFLLRLTLGLNILLHGVVRLISGTSAFAGTMVHEFTHTPLPGWSVYGFALCLPWAEAIIGLALFLGLATRLALVMGALEIAALTFGTTMRQDWSAAAIQLTYAVAYAALLATVEYNGISADKFFLRTPADEWRGGPSCKSREE